MRVALVHYHLRRGGVSSVVLNQARTLAGTGAELLIIAGEAADPDFPFALVEGLAYDRPGEARSTPLQAERLAVDILRAMEEHWGAWADIVHVHNPLIQKNCLLIPALTLLAGRGLRLFLQNHDLAEDFRPDVYAGAVEYPENCHYGVINSRDYACLLRAGLRAEGLHLIPNQVSSLRPSAGPEKRTRYLYPVRAIRRKNIGEALLLSLFIFKGKTVAFTLPPSEKDAAPYRRWRGFAAELDLPAEFELGLRHSLPELLNTSVCALSTSVKEGFGFSFLEPWTAGRGLFGRSIDYVRADFERAGVRFDGLYPSLEIPLEYIPPGLERKMEAALGRIYQSFGLAVPEQLSQSLARDMAARNTIDYGRLDEESQEAVIRACHGDLRIRQRVAALNPLLEALGGWQEDEELIEANRRVITEQYGGERIVELLLGIYQSVIDKPVIQRVSKKALLELYLDPLRLSLVGISNG